MAAILSTRFTVPVSDWAVTWTLASVTGVQVGHLCAAESELAQVTKVGPGTTLTLRRGVEGSAVAAHAMGTPVAIARAGDVDTSAPVLGPAAVPLRQAVVTLTDAQIKASPMVYPEVLPAPGVGKVLVPALTLAFVDNAAGVYTGVDGDGYALLVYGDWARDATSAIPPANFHSVIGAGPVTLVPFGTLTELTSAPIGQVAVLNAPLRLAFSNAAELTGGHPSNTLHLSVAYYVLDHMTGRYV